MSLGSYIRSSLVAITIDDEQKSRKEEKFFHGWIAIRRRVIIKSNGTFDLNSKFEFRG